MSFCLDILWGEVESKGALGDILRMLAHGFYVPTSILGPIVRYRDFNRGVSGRKKWKC